MEPLAGVVRPRVPERGATAMLGTQAQLTGSLPILFGGDRVHAQVAVRRSLPPLVGGKVGETTGVICILHTHAPICNATLRGCDSAPPVLTAKAQCTRGNLAHVA